MTIRRRLQASAGAALLVFVLAPAAHAGPAGKWSAVTAPSNNTLEIGLARTGDGVLHVLWVLDENPQDSQSSVVGSRISADAKTVIGPVTVQAYPGGANNRVALTAAPEGLRAFFAGLFPNNALDEVMATSTSADGASWTQATVASDGRTASRSNVYAAAGIGGVVASGTPVSVWGDSSPGAAGYHMGLDSNESDVHFGGPRATVDGPNAAADSVTGQLVIGWNDIDAGRVLTQSLSPAGAKGSVPGGQAPDLLERVAMTGRIGADGIYVAYLKGSNPFSSRPSIWRVGAGSGTTVSKANGRLAGVAAAPGGRLWSFWIQSDPIGVFARRSNEAATKWGELVSIKPPSKTTAIHSLEGEGSAGPLDLVALLERSNEIRNWHQRVLPGLTLKAAGGNNKASFTVTDAGAPVKDATVKFAGTSKKTNSAGKVTIAAPEGKRNAAASKSGYTPDKAKVTVK